MIETIKHLFGACGEHWHPNIFTLMAGTVASLPGLSYIKYKIKRNRL